jgi:hypothetical protein
MATFTLEADCHTALARLFEADKDHHLRFGWSGLSVESAQHGDLLAGPVRFRDYIMEGFLFYLVQVEDVAPGCLLRVHGEGSNRDWSIGPQIKHYISAAGLKINN